jgi:uncharacterized protein YecT (DUF1311 family)
VAISHDVGVRAILLLSVGMLVSCGQQPQQRPPAATTPTDVATQDPCRSAQTQVEMTRCWSEAAIAAERRSGEAYQNVVNWLDQRQQQDATKQFAETQSRWEAYRDAECEGVSAVWEDGSMAALQRAQCRVRLAEQRRSELELVMADANN